MVSAALVYRLVLPALFGLAVAQPTAAQSLANVSLPTAMAAPLDLRRLSSPYDAGQALKAAGIARTSLDRSLGRSEATASFGLLCGLTQTPDVHGGANAFGYDREGRFLGAQLHLAFR